MESRFQKDPYYSMGENEHRMTNEMYDTVEMLLHEGGLEFTWLWRDS
jgi:hypothetical protein